jgi:hypothetical protein
MRTFDKDTKKSLRFYTIEKVSENREKTPEGYLVCYAAKLSRTGVMTYKADEVPITPSSDGFVKVVRYEEDVFKESAITSALGKSVVNNHPTDSDGNPVDVLPENWKNYEVGTVLNPRRGEGDTKDCLVADLFIKDATAIQLIEDGKVQLSCGYDAEYKELSPGFAKQYDIIINHVALVDNGRCGPRCAIMDEDTLKLNDINTSGKRKMDKLAQAFTNLKQSIKTVDTIMEEKDNPALAAILAKLDGIEGRLNKLEVIKVTDRRRDDDDDDDDRKRHRDDDDDDDRKRRHRDDDDDDRKRHRDARKRRHDDDDDDDDDDKKKHRDDDDDDKKRRDDKYQYTMHYRGAHQGDKKKKRDDDDDDRKHRDDDDDDDKKRRDDKYQYTMHYRGAHQGDKKKKRDDDDDDRKHRDDDDDDDDDDKKRRDARKRRHDDDDAFMTDPRKKRRDDDDDDRKRRDDDDDDDDDKKRRDKRRTKDSSHLADTWQETISFAEVLIPGIQPPKFVRDADAFVTLDALCQFRKGVLQQFATDEKNKSLIVELYGSVPSYQSMSCSAAKTLFRDAALVMKRVNNHNNKTSDVAFGIQSVNNSVVSSPKAMNDYYEKYWNGQYGQK